MLRIIDTAEQTEAMTYHVTSFMGSMYHAGSIDEIRATILSLSHGDYSYVITPNADILVNMLSGVLPAYVSQKSSLFVCDSRIVARLASTVDKHLTCYPGSDIVKDMLRMQSATGRLIGIAGPSRQDFDDLQLRYPKQPFRYIDAPYGLVRGTPAWRDFVATVAAADWDVLFVCLGSPKQEMLAYDLSQHGRSHGVALCVGASIDFLTGRQKRAPRFFQSLALEWLYRLGTNPRRMWKRYLVNSPKLLGYFIKLELLRR